MSKLVTIYGGSGFVGRYVARRMAKEGWRIRIAVRRPNDALFLKTYGVVGQVEAVLCNIRDDASVAQAMRGADVVVNCVGTFDRKGKNSFDAVASGAGRIARLANEQGVPQMVHISAIGADAKGASEYARAKAAAELAVLTGFPSAVILRPSVVFGSDDKFFNKFAGLAQCLPLLPIAGANSLMQPVYVDDVAEAVVAALSKNASGVYELGGPEVASLKSLLGTMFEVIQRRGAVINLPFAVMKVFAGGLDLAQTLSLGLVRNNLITADQLQMLRQDNVVGAEAKGFADLGLEPVSFKAHLEEYLWRFRPSGQFAAIKDSAKKLKKV